MAKKYKASVGIHTYANKYIGEIEFDTIEEYNELSEALWKDFDYDYPTVNISNDFDLGDWDLDDITEDDLKYYEQKGE